jgi:hypothetical protein
MKEREFRGFAAVLAAAALVFFGRPGLADGAELSPVVPEAEGETASAAGEPVSAYLEYQELAFSFKDLPLTTNARNEPFKKEPGWGGGRLLRGSLQLGSEVGNEVGFVWDRGAGKLCLDLNQNLDLTDDPGGVFARQAGGQEYFQTFTNIHLPCKTLNGKRPVLADLKLYYNNGPHGSVQMRSVWQGKVTLHGEDWQAGLLVSSDRGDSVHASSLLLRPWAERNERFSCVFNNDSLAAFPFSEKVFFGGRGYRVQYTKEGQGESARLRLQFTEQKPKLGGLRVTGDSVHRVLLQGGPYVVVADKPHGLVKVPVGSYGQSKVWLKQNLVEAYPEQRLAITVSVTKPVVLTTGGPLTNSVSVSSRGRHLVMGYQLLGQGGVYQLANQDRSHPPEFTVYQGDKKLTSGRFEFG